MSPHNCDFQRFQLDVSYLIISLEWTGSVVFCCLLPVVIEKKVYRCTTAHYKFLCSFSIVSFGPLILSCVFSAFRSGHLVNLAEEFNLRYPRREALRENVYWYINLF